MTTQPKIAANAIGVRPAEIALSHLSQLSRRQNSWRINHLGGEHVGHAICPGPVPLVPLGQVGQVVRAHLSQASPRKLRNQSML